MVFMPIRPVGMSMDMLMQVHFLVEMNFAVLHEIDGTSDFSHEIDFMGNEYVGKIEAGQYIF